MEKNKFLDIVKKKIIKDSVVTEYIYNTTVLRELAKKLMIWADLEESMFIQEFMCEHKLSYDAIMVFKKRSPEFAEAHSYARMKIAHKLHAQTGKGRFNTSVYNRLIRMYDTELKQLEDEDREQDYKLKAKYMHETLDQKPMTVNIVSYKGAVEQAKERLQAKGKARWKDDRADSNTEG